MFFCPFFANLYTKIRNPGPGGGCQIVIFFEKNQFGIDTNFSGWVYEILEKERFFLVFWEFFWYFLVFFNNSPNILSNWSEIFIKIFPKCYDWVNFQSFILINYLCYSFPSMLVAMTWFFQPKVVPFLRRQK